VAKLLCEIAFLSNVAAGVIASTPLALMQALHCHCGRHPGVVAIVAIVAIVALASLWSSG
jgi:hypothetical protein